MFGIFESMMFLFPRVGYVNFLEGIKYKELNGVHLSGNKEVRVVWPNNDTYFTNLEFPEIRPFVGMFPYYPAIWCWKASVAMQESRRFHNKTTDHRCCDMPMQYAHPSSIYQSTITRMPETRVGAPSSWQSKLSWNLACMYHLRSWLRSDQITNTTQYFQ